MRVFLTSTSEMPRIEYEAITNFLNQSSGFVSFVETDKTLSFQSKDILTRQVSQIEFEHKQELDYKNLIQFIKNSSLPFPFCWFRNSIYFELKNNRLQLSSHQKLEQIKEELTRFNFFKMLETNQSSEIKKLKTYSFPYNQKYVRNYAVFEKCSEIRTQLNMKDEDFLVFLSPYSQEHNWFYTLDPSCNNNIMVNINEWEYFGFPNATYPIAYCITSALLNKKIYVNYIDWYLNQHPKGKGCITDFCWDKIDIETKIKGARICNSCYSRIDKNRNNYVLIGQMLEIFNSIRENTTIIKADFQPSKLLLEKNGKRLVFTDIKKSVQLYPLEAAFYRIYLNHEEGLSNRCLRNKKSELNQIYKSICPRKDPALVSDMIQNIVKHGSDRPSELRSTINKKIMKTIPKFDAQYYVIKKTPKNKISILADRKGVTLPPNLEGTQDRTDKNSRWN